MAKNQKRLDRNVGRGRRTKNRTETRSDALLRANVQASSDHNASAINNDWRWRLAAAYKV